MSLITKKEEELNKGADKKKRGRQAAKINQTVGEESRVTAPTGRPC